MKMFNGVKVFSSTMLADRATLGDRVTLWLNEHHEIDLVDLVVTQSSDSRFHCTAITIFYRSR
jgi:hypothetical protein